MINSLILFIAVTAISFGVQIKQDFIFDQEKSLSSLTSQEVHPQISHDGHKEVLKREMRTPFLLFKIFSIKEEFNLTHTLSYIFYLPIYLLYQVKEYYLVI